VTLLLPLMGFLFVSLLVAAVALSMTQGATATIERRLGELRGPGAISAPKATRLTSTLKRLGKLAPQNPSDLSKIRQRLIASGYRNAEAVTVFFGVRIGLALLFFGLVSSPLLGRRGVVTALIGAALGYLLPNMALGRMAQRRQHRIRLSLPDALDLLVVSVEAGLGLDQAIQRVSEELALAHPDLCDELRLVNLELRAGKPRGEALRNLGERTGVEDLTSLTAMLIQTDRFGTSVARSLRVHSETMRSKRKQRAEEAAAKTGVKMVFPLVFCIFPAVWVVTIGPAAIKFVEVLMPFTRR
jgi:tight adherence protein C